MELQQIPMSHDMTLLHLPGERFRTGRLTGIFAVPLAEDTAAGYALLPGLLTRRSGRYPTVAALSRRLDELYGATVEGEVTRLGHWQVRILSPREETQATLRLSTAVLAAMWLRISPIVSFVLPSYPWWIRQERDWTF